MKIVYSPMRRGRGWFGFEKFGHEHDSWKDGTSSTATSTVESPTRGKDGMAIDLAAKEGADGCWPPIDWTASIALRNKKANMCC